ncbi:MAG: hypothetical protein LBH16_01705 [Treponema sp.]|jgi:hypothetical protein|nr:hypothetical protein [Treponema sp.]
MDILQHIQQKYAAELKSKTIDEQIKFIKKVMPEEQEIIVKENAKEFIDNSKKVSKIQNALENQIIILAKNVGKKTSASQVSVVGYISDKKLIIVLNNDKLYQIKEDDIITSADQIVISKSKKKATPKKSETTKKK